MNVEQMKLRLTEIYNKMEDFASLETFSNEQYAELNGLKDEADELVRSIEAKEKIESLKAMSSNSQRQAAPAPTARVEVKASRLEKNGGFTSFGDFAMSVRKSASGDIDQRFKSYMNERTGEEGGWLVPEEMMTAITKKITSDESLLSKTRQFTVAGNNLTLPIDEGAPWSGGIQAYWTAEGASITESQKSMPGQASFRLNKLAAMIRTTDELLDDARALESYILALAPEAITHKLNESIISGNGVGKPTGILNSGFKVVVAKEVGQAADTIVAKNIIKMYSRMIPSARANAVWYINAGVEEQLRFMKDDLGNFIYLAPGSQMNQSPYGLLLGRPVIAMLGSLPELGTSGDILFADLGYYYSVLKSGGLKSAMSTHLHFDKDISAYRFTFRIDGKSPFSTPVTTQYGNYQMSAFVVLEDR